MFICNIPTCFFSDAVTKFDQNPSTQFRTVPGLLGTHDGGVSGSAYIGIVSVFKVKGNCGTGGAVRRLEVWLWEWSYQIEIKMGLD